jgi:FkbH-like protein
MTSGVAPKKPGVAVCKPRRGRVKCVVWDLDNTVWDGVLLEGDDVRLRTDVVAVIRKLDRLGILHSVASKNDYADAMQQLRAFEIDDLFLYPQVSWNAKSHSIRQIASSLNIGLEAIAIVDDQAFERAEVALAVPEVICVDVADLAAAVRTPEFRPRFVTVESQQRRNLYRCKIARDAEEQQFVGSNEEFLASLEMVLTIASAGRDDLQRAEELTVRTNQLNSTGRIYSYAELDELRSAPNHLLLVASLKDRFGSYGTIGLALVGQDTDTWTLRLLLVSCRVVSRGVGTALLNYVMGLARDAGVRLRADLVETGRNRMMRVAYAFAGFQEVSHDADHAQLEADLGTIQPWPSYIRLETRVFAPAQVASTAGEDTT